MREDQDRGRLWRLGICVSWTYEHTRRHDQQCKHTDSRPNIALDTPSYASDEYILYIATGKWNDLFTACVCVLDRK